MFPTILSQYREVILSYRFVDQRVVEKVFNKTGWNRRSTFLRDTGNRSGIRQKHIRHGFALLFPRFWIRIAYYDLQYGFQRVLREEKSKSKTKQ